MKYAKIVGGRKLKGEVQLQGSKNALLPILAASVLCHGEVVIENCPDISDKEELLFAMACAGVTYREADGVLTLHTEEVHPFFMGEELSKKTRGGVLFLGAFLGRFHEAGMAYPGGCVIGKRPIDLHCKVFRALQADTRETEDGIFLSGKPVGGTIVLTYPSVGATENALLASVCAKGRTNIYGAAKEPEITELCCFLKKAGAGIFGIGTSHLVIDGVEKLTGVTHRLSGDRIVAGTCLAAVAMTGGGLWLKGTKQVCLQGIVPVLRKTGLDLSVSEDVVIAKANGCIRPVSYLETTPFPGFPTDMQSQMLAVLSLAEGESIVCETVFESRFGVVPELRNMGADIIIQGKCAKVKGRNALHGAKVHATDLRSGAALLMAGLAAEGETTVTGYEYITRGYERICEVFAGLGAEITEMEE